MEGSHRKVVGTGMMNGELLCKVIQRVEVVARIEALLILTVAALDFAVVPRRIRADQLVPDAQLGNSVCKSRLLLEKRLVNSKPLSVWTHSTRMPRRAYHAVSLRRKSAEE